MPRPVKGRGLRSLYHLLQHTAPCGGTIWFPLTVEYRQGLLAPLLWPVQLGSDLHLRFYWYRSHTHTGSLIVRKAATVFVMAFAVS